MSMTRSEMEERVIDILVQTFELERAKVGPHSRLVEDLDLDSIDALDMVVELQTLLRGRIDERDMKGLRTVADVVAMVEQQLQRSPIASAS
jgi:acyl carrier protein